MMRPSLSKSPTVTEAKQFVRTLIRWIGAGFHPDTDMADYVMDDGSKCFSPRLAAELNCDLYLVWGVLESESIDIYALSLPVQRQILLSRRLAVVNS